jgi:ABC-type multidrug transport system fused ATPase/permease subunit
VSLDDAKKPRPSALVSWKRIWREAADVRPQLALGCVFLVFSSLSFNALPYLAGRLLDAVASGPAAPSPAAARARLDAVVLQLVGVAALSGLASGVRSYLFNSASERVVARVRSRLFRALCRQDLSFFDANTSGSLLSRVSADTESLKDAATTNVSILLRSVANVTVALAMMLATSWRLTLLALGITPAVALCVAHFGRALRQLAKDTRAAAAEASSVAGDTLGAIRAVKAFAREAAEAAHFDAAVDKTLALGIATAARGSVFMSLSTSVMISVVALVFWFGGVQVLHGRMSVGALQAFVLYAVGIAGAVGGLSSVVISLMTAVGASERVFELMDREPALAPAGTLRPFDGRAAISAELRGVWFAYPTRPDAWVLRGVNLLVPEGTTVALCGPSGSGKSTVAALLERFYDPQRGVVLLAGVPAPHIAAAHLHRALGLVAQEPLLLARSIRDNIALSVERASEEDIKAAAAAANATAFIEAYENGFDTQVGERGVQLSGGQKQRVALARALLARPLLLLLVRACACLHACMHACMCTCIRNASADASRAPQDEATSALDAESEAAVVDALAKARVGRTALIIAHRLSTVRDADCIAVLVGGVVEERGTHEELVARPGGVYARLVARQLAGGDGSGGSGGGGDAPPPLSLTLADSDFV